MKIKIKKTVDLIRCITYIIAVGFFTFSCSKNVIIIDDPGGVLGRTNAPFFVNLELDKEQIIALEEGRLGLIELSTQNLIPVQLSKLNKETDSTTVIFLPNGELGQRKFKLVEKDSPIGNEIKARLDSNTGQVIIEEKLKRVLQYNYQTVYEKDVIRNRNDNIEMIEYSGKLSGIYFEEYLKSHPDFPKDTIVTSAIYAIPRSDYIHPLYGLEGEMLTNDWPDAGHPHHRGIFWAWPEVKYGDRLGDIYALQTVFARPSGNIELISGHVYAEIDAENLWMWEDKKPIVRERAIIRVYRSASDNQIIDLTIKLQAIEDSVTVATRFTNSYGGLNIRMQSPESQQISYFMERDDTKPLRAWSDFCGIFEGNNTFSGLMVLQHKDNPQYPGVWVEYPNLSWVQPTFPSPDTRFLLSTKEALTLRYRLIIHKGGRPEEDISKSRWDAYNSPLTPL